MSCTACPLLLMPNCPSLLHHLSCQTAHLYSTTYHRNQRWKAVRCSRLFRTEREDHASHEEWLQRGFIVCAFTSPAEPVQGCLLLMKMSERLAQTWAGQPLASW